MGPEGDGTKGSFVGLLGGDKRGHAMLPEEPSEEQAAVVTLPGSEPTHKQI